MARKPNEKAIKAKKLYDAGKKLVEIAAALDLPEGTVRRWKSTYKWGSDNNERSDVKANVRVRMRKKEIKEDVKAVIENEDLTHEQQLFCLYFSRSLNATSAYKKAYGCSYQAALASGSRLLGNVKIREEIQRLKKERYNRELLSEPDIFQKYMDIAFSDITDYLSFGQEEVPVIGEFGPVMVPDPDTGEKVQLMKRVSTVRLSESYEVDGTLIQEVKQGKDGVSIKLLDKQKALDWLASHMDLATEEQKARVASLRAKTDQMKGERDNDAIARLDGVLKEIKGVV